MASVYVSNGDFVGREESMKSPGSFMYRKKLSRTESEVNDFVNLLHGSDPLRVELNRLDNEVRDKDRELGDAHTEIKALKYTDRLKERALEELTDELNKVDEKLKATEDLVENKNLEIKKINEEKKSALAAQFAAEATLRRVHAAQKDDEMPPIEAIIAPLEAELKLARSEVAKLQDDNRALDRLTKSKEAALMEAQKTVEIALIKASLVDDLQNKNQELLKQIEICQEENRILDKMQRQKVSEVEKLTQTVHELEEAVLSGGAAANAVRDYQRKVQEMNEEMRTLDRELARAKISANRVAVVVANDWKDGNDKVMPVRQWLEERRFFRGEMQQLKDKLVVAERAAKSEAELKEKYQLRFKVLEERLKSYPNGTTSRRLSIGGSDNLSKSPQCGQVRQSSAVALLRRAKNSSRSLDDDVSKKSEKENGEIGKIMDKSGGDNGDFVCGVLYDMLQKEVISLRKACNEKDQKLKDKDYSIEMLAEKVDKLNKIMEIESKKTRREISVMEKELISMRNKDQNGARTLLPRNGSNRHY